jgi:hypothetical protein
MRQSAPSRGVVAQIADAPAATFQTPGDDVAAKAMSYTQQAHRQADVELQRRLIEESARASSRLLFATWVIAILTAIIIAITILELAGALD